MKHIFYFIGLFVFIYELLCFLSFTKRIENIKEGVKTKDPSLESNISTFILLWLLLGIFTFQWPLFIFLFILSFLPGRVRRIMGFGFTYTVFYALESLIMCFAVLFAIINSYHLKIDIWKYITQNL